MFKSDTCNFENSLQDIDRTSFAGNQNGQGMRSDFDENFH